MCTIFLNRKNACHICQMNVRLIFQQIPQKIKILFLGIFIFLVLSENTVPLINNNNKCLLFLCIYILHAFNKICIIKIIHIRIFIFQFTNHQPLKTINQFINALAAAQKFLHINRDCIISVQMLCKVITSRNLKL